MNSEVPTSLLKQKKNKMVYEVDIRSVDFNTIEVGNWDANFRIIEVSNRDTNFNSVEVDNRDADFNSVWHSFPLLRNLIN